MGFVPEELEKLADGSAFLQEREDCLYLYYSVDTIQKACNVGVQDTVADSVHTPQPEELERHSQLYCVHGVCDRGHSVTLSSNSEKDRNVYARIIGHLKKTLEQNGR